MEIYNSNNEPLTEEEIEEIKKDPQYRERVKKDLALLNSSINNLVLDRDRSDKIIGLVIGTGISCFLTNITDAVGLTEASDGYSAVRIAILISSIIIGIVNLTKNHSRNTKIYILNDIKKNIIKENDWLSNNQKTLKY